MKNSLKLLYTSKVFQVTLVITLFWTWLDANERFGASDGRQDRKNTSFVIEPLKSPQITLQQMENIFAGYPKELPKTLLAIPVKSDVMSEAEQYQQSGELDKLYVGKNLLTLKAIIIAGSEQSLGKVMPKSETLHQALILVKSINSDDQKIEKFNNGDNVYGFKLQVDSNKRVTLTRAVNSANDENIAMDDKLSTQNTGQQHIQEIALTLYKVN